MNNAWKTAAIFAVALLLSACNNGSSGGGGNGNAGSGEVSFSNLVAQVFDQGPNDEPIAVNDRNVSDDGGSLASTLNN